MATTTKRTKELLRKLAEARAEKAEAEKVIKAVQTELLEIMSSKGATVVNAEMPDGTTLRATRIVTEKVVFDETRIIDELSPRLRTLVTTTVLDKQALEQAVADGTVQAEWVAERSEVVTGTPYIKVSVGKVVK